MGYRISPPPDDMFISEPARFGVYSRLAKELPGERFAYLLFSSDGYTEESENRIIKWYQDVMDALGWNMMAFSMLEHYVRIDWKRREREPLRLRRLILHGLEVDDVERMLRYLGRAFKLHPSGAYQHLDPDTQLPIKAWPIVAGAMYDKDTTDDDIQRRVLHPANDGESEGVDWAGPAVLHLRNLQASDGDSGGDAA